MTSSATAIRSVAHHHPVFAQTEPDRDHPLDADTIAFRVVGDLRLALVLTSGLIMQTAHPVVDAGVDQHSIYAEKPWERLINSLMPILGCVYDGLDAAETGRRVREAHKAIKGVDSHGRRYHAMNPDAYAWVWATIYDAVVRCQDVFGKPLTADERARFYHEWRYVGLTMGLRAQDMPGDLDAFYGYFDSMIAQRLRSGVVPANILVMIGNPAPPPGWPLGRAGWWLARQPIRRVVRSATKATLPDGLRRRLGLEWSARDMLESAVYGLLIRILFAVVPQRFSYFPRAYQGILRARGAGARRVRERSA